MSSGGHRLVDLDDLNRLAELDSEDVLGAVERFADQCRHGWEIGRAATDLPDATGADSIVVLGMGGSGVSGDVVQAVVEPRLPLPLRTIKTYGPLPAWVARNTIVFAVSYSGGTEETLAAVSEAQERGCRSVTLSSGGPLAEFAAEHGLAHLTIPAGLQPRASLGFLSMPLLAVLGRLGLIQDLQSDVDEAEHVLRNLGERCHRKVAADENPAKQLAVKIVGKVPIVYGGYGLGAAAAYRFKCDLNEYGKTPAFWDFYPELDHNEIVGWNRLSDLTRDNFVNVLLRDSGEHERVDLRFEITRRLTEDKFAEVAEVRSEGVSPLARLLSFILTTQLTSIYVGLGYAIDPGPVEVITALKNELADR